MRVCATTPQTCRLTMQEMHIHISITNGSIHGVVEAVGHSRHAPSQKRTTLHNPPIQHTRQQNQLQQKGMPSPQQHASRLSDSCQTKKNIIQSAAASQQLLSAALSITHMHRAARCTPTLRRSSSSMLHPFKCPIPRRATSWSHHGAGSARSLCPTASHAVVVTNRQHSKRVMPPILTT
jgi:hypothetical protein